jgi:hypothetical protein
MKTQSPPRACRAAEPVPELGHRRLLVAQARDERPGYGTGGGTARSLFFVAESPAVTELGALPIRAFSGQHQDRHNPTPNHTDP